MDRTSRKPSKLYTRNRRPSRYTLGAMRWVFLVVLATAALTPLPAAAQEADASAQAPDAVAPKKSGPLKQLFVTLARDIKALPSRDNAAVLINGGLLAVAVFPLDDMAKLRASSSPFLQ